MELSRVTLKGQITLPASIRRRMGISKGDTVAFALAQGGVLIKPISILDKTKTPEWRKRLARALQDDKAGRGTYHNDAEALLKALEQ